jgi:hypothetical protein
LLLVLAALAPRPVLQMGLIRDAGTIMLRDHRRQNEFAYSAN